MPILLPPNYPHPPATESDSRLWVARFRIPAPANQPLRFALLSDPHIGSTRDTLLRGQTPAACLAANLASVRRRQCGASLWLGDIARSEGLPGDYELFREIAAPLFDQAPGILTTGNHDQRSEIINAFMRPAPEDADGKLHVLTCLETPYARMFVLDTALSPAVVGGAVGKRQLQWIASELAQADERPILVALHHPPDDEDENLLDSERLAAVLQRDPRVKLILHGHVHRWGRGEFAGVPVCSLPSCGFWFEPTDWVGWVQMELTPVGLLLSPIPLHPHPEGTLEPYELLW